MATDELFILPNDVQFIPIGSVHEKIKKNFEYDGTDIVVTHMHSRNTSKVIGRDIAEMLKKFETAKSLAEVIFDFSLQHKKDPQQVADQAFGLLMEMKMEGFLVPYKDGGQANKQGLLKINGHFRHYVVKEKWQSYEDSEVYKVADDKGKNYAVKFLKTGQNELARLMFKNESEILRKLDGTVNPKLINEGIEDAVPYFITEWVDGVNSESEAKKYGNFNIRNNVIKVLDLCVAILRAYHHLHKQGILHSDIHSGNILISAEGLVKIIDYGFSSIIGEDRNIIRGGVCFHYEPEFAAAITEGRISPRTTEKGEQYSLATLLYLLISGHTYLDFSLEKDKLYEQIPQDEPHPFREFDLNLPPGLDKVFFVALSKDPEKRFPSLVDFMNAIIEIRDNIYADPNFFVANKAYSEDRFIQFLIRKFGWNSPLIEDGLALAPACSVNLGAAGIAYMFYRMACIREESNLLDLADIWANRARDYSSDYDHGFYSPDLDVTATSVGKRSLYHSPTGVFLIQAMISHCKGDINSLYQALNGFLIAAKEPCDKIDLVLGKAGLLVGSSIFLNELETMNDFNCEPITSLANKMMEEIWNQLDEYPGLNKTNPVNYFGIAHGWAGLLYATLMWCRASKQYLPKNFINRMEQLLACRIQKENLVYWPVSHSQNAPWTGWCHGSAGHSFLWSLLYKHFKEEKFLAIAEQSATHILTDIQNNNGSLCCGMAGQAYALLGLFNHTGNKNYLTETKKIKQRLLNHISSPLLKNNSLYKGEVGLGVLLCELENPAFARMPFFE